MVTRLIHWVRNRPWPAAASALGLVFVPASFAVHGHPRAFLLEVGVSLGLVVILFKLTKDLEANQDEQLAKLEEALVSRFEGPPQQAAAEVVRRSRDDVMAAASTFEADPTPTTLADLVHHAMAVNQPTAVRVELVPGWSLNVGVTRNPYNPGEDPRPIVNLKVIDEANRSLSEAVNWRDDVSYGDMLEALRSTWIRFCKQWPGDETFVRIDFPSLISRGFVESIEKVSRGRGD